MYVSFKNPGLIDLRAVKTFGVSVKEKNNPIGYFGTGLKYAVAILLREGHEVSIWRGNEAHFFGTKPVEIRGQTFNVVTLDDDEIGMTLDVGKNWKLWMALRELQSNVLDENGFSEAWELPPEDGYTTIVVNGRPFFEAYQYLHEIFLPTEPRLRSGNCDIHDGSAQCVYNKGVKALALNRPTTFTYNIVTPMQLTEDRTIAYSFLAQEEIAQALCRCKDKQILRRALTAGEGYLEYHLDYHHVHGKPTQEFLDTLRGLRQEGVKLPTAMSVVLATHTDGPDITEAPITAIQADVIAHAINFLSAADFPVGKYPIKVASDLGHGIMGRADRSNKVIWLSSQCLMMGSNYIISTLFEEFVHLEHHYDDCTRSMQNFLFETLIHFMQRAVSNA